ncbi:MAG: 3-methylcrotonyl-CoA carboxylase, partial [Alphaproteobacteria bacterium]|nr:3-methylcrotonyl-CoA carboxylase [Alphaproteobacteria bacterium]
LLERYIARPRHVEVQVLADAHGKVLHLLDRDCSIQRRHQKVIEEAPAPGLPDSLRAEMGAAAVRLAQAIGYVGAGTVEFLVENDSAFHFIEMNTRLQVEHPVTEMVTGLDLVEWQLRIAAGEALTLSQEDVAASGHAVEARLYAEDPARGFLPQTGRLAHLAFPENRAGLRIDSGVETGDEITPFYDPMIAKVVTWGEDRERARLALADALADTRIAGLNTNLFFLETLVRHPAFADGALHTHFIDEHSIAAVEPPAGDAEAIRAFAAVAVLENRTRRLKARQERAPDRFSPWGRADAWRLNNRGSDRLEFDDGGETMAYEVFHTDGGYRLDGGERAVSVSGAARGADGGLIAEIDGRRQSGTVIADGDRLTVFLDGARREILLIEPGAAAMSSEVAGGRLTSPMPGTVVRVLVEAGQTVRKDAPLIVLEAMKMEHTIAAPADGTVESLPFAVGDRVEEGVELVGFRAAT